MCNWLASCQENGVWICMSSVWKSQSLCAVLCVDMDPQWLMFISLSSSSSAEKAENLTGSHSRVRRLTRHAVWVLLNSGTVTKRTSWPSAPGRKRIWHVSKQQREGGKQLKWIMADTNVNTPRNEKKGHSDHSTWTGQTDLWWAWTQKLERCHWSKHGDTPPRWKGLFGKMGNNLTQNVQRTVWILWTCIRQKVRS